MSGVCRSVSTHCKCSIITTSNTTRRFRKQTWASVKTDIFLQVTFLFQSQRCPKNIIILSVWHRMFWVSDGRNLNLTNIKGDILHHLIS